MGQEASAQIDESVPPQTLRERSLDAVAELIRSGRAKRIVALTGAGISTAAGIPDFRSPGTGLYANLQRLDLPYAEAVFSIDYFRQNPHPFYVLAKELYPGKFHPTVSHAFLALLAQKGLLEMLFTQNIDCLERRAGVPAERIVEAHGSFATQRCIDCHTPYPDDLMLEHVKEAKVPRCQNPACPAASRLGGDQEEGAESGPGGLVKPDIVFFGESLPPRFHQLAPRHLAQPGAVDLLLVLGTSLTVYPFAGLPAMAPEPVPRVLFNREVVGDLGTRADDVLALGSCDSGVLQLADALGWRAELEAHWRGLVGDAEAERQLRQDVLLAAQPGPRGEDGFEEESEEEEEGEHEGEEEEEELEEQPPEIGTPLSSAEAEVNEIASEIEAALRLDSSEEQHQHRDSAKENAEPEPTADTGPSSSSAAPAQTHKKDEAAAGLALATSGGTAVTEPLQLAPETTEPAEKTEKAEKPKQPGDRPQL